MKRNVSLFLIAVLFCIRSSESASDTNFSCDNAARYHFDRKFITCWTSVHQQNVPLPDDIPKDIEYLTIVANNGSTLWIDRIDMFQNFKSLVGLEITLSKSVFISEFLLDPETKPKLQHELFVLPSIKILKITFSEEFNKKKYNWVLPASLQEFALFNSTIDFDLKECVNLRKLNLSRTNLSKMPVTDELLYLTSLDLRFNPLNEFTISDIANFCSLNFLAIQDANMNKCECIKLMTYIKLMQNKSSTFEFVGSLNCDDTNSENHNCSTFDLNEALGLRRKCVVVLMRYWAVLLGYVALITLFLIAFVAGCCVFFLKNFTNIGSYMKD